MIPANWLFPTAHRSADNVRCCPFLTVCLTTTSGNYTNLHPNTQHCALNPICETDSQTFDILKVKLSITIGDYVYYT